MTIWFPILKGASRLGVSPRTQRKWTRVPLVTRETVRSNPQQVRSTGPERSSDQPEPRVVRDRSITPRWQYVLAGATPKASAIPSWSTKPSTHGSREHSARRCRGISIHTANALRGYEIGTLARERGAYVIFGGIHATLYPEEARAVGRSPLRGAGRWRRGLAGGAGRLREGHPQRVTTEARSRPVVSSPRAGS